MNPQQYFQKLKTGWRPLKNLGGNIIDWESYNNEDIAESGELLTIHVNFSPNYKLRLSDTMGDKLSDNIEPSRPQDTMKLVEFLSKKLTDEFGGIIKDSGVGGGVAHISILYGDYSSAEGAERYVKDILLKHHITDAHIEVSNVNANLAEDHPCYYEESYSNKFNRLVIQLLESNTAGAGGCLGTPAQPIYDPNTQATSGDTYRPNDARNLFGSPESDKRGKKKRKKNLPKIFPKVIKRTFQNIF